MLLFPENQTVEEGEHREEGEAENDEGLEELVARISSSLARTKCLLNNRVLLWIRNKLRDAHIWLKSAAQTALFVFLKLM